MGVYGCSRSEAGSEGPALVGLMMNLSAFHRELIPQRGLSLGQYIGLRFVQAHEPVRISVLAESSLVSRPTATAFVDGLERRGWVVRRRSSKDRRSVVLGLTAKARRTLEAIDREQARFVRRAFARLAPEGRRQTVEWLTELNGAIAEELATRRARPSRRRA